MRSIFLVAIIFKKFLKFLKARITAVSWSQASHDWIYSGKHSIHAGEVDATGGGCLIYDEYMVFRLVVVLRDLK